MVYEEELQDQRIFYTIRYKVNRTDVNYLGSPTCPPPKEFTRNREQFGEFCCKLRASMSLLSPIYSHMFKMIEDDPTQVIQYDDLHVLHQHIRIRYNHASVGHIYTMCKYGIRITERHDNVVYRTG